MSIPLHIRLREIVEHIDQSLKNMQMLLLKISKKQVQRISWNCLRELKGSIGTIYKNGLLTYTCWIKGFCDDAIRKIRIDKLSQQTFRH